MFPYIPEGENVAYTHGTPFFQILTDTIEANTTYTLSFWAGERQDSGNEPFYENQGYFGELAADTGNGNYFARTVIMRTTAHFMVDAFNYPSINAPDAPRPGFGEWLFITLTYAFGETDPLIGQRLIISFASPGVQSNFDAVTLDASLTATPEPASYALMLAGLAAVGWMRRTRR
jgi:hypothetical protein